MSRLSQVMNNRKPGAKTIICNTVTASNWSAPYIAAARYLNGQLAASRYAPLVADMYTATTQSDGTPIPAHLADQIHRNDTGTVALAGVVNAKMTALGWS